LNTLFTDDDNLILFMDQAGGTKVYDLIIESSGNISAIYNIGFQIGRTLRGIHDVKHIDISGSKIKAKHLLHMVKFTKAPADLISDFIRNPGLFTHVHGDPSADNLFFDKNGDRVVIIDAGNYRGTMDPDSFGPVGFPACDYYRFIGSIGAMIRRAKVGENVNSEVIKGFREGYGDQFGVFTIEADRLFSHYWLKVVKFNK
jgi:tRNA A-37 threonylcarbamoyl transferase component Bud32